jgi:hypothetical protein
MRGAATALCTGLAYLALTTAVPAQEAAKVPGRTALS